MKTRLLVLILGVTLAAGSTAAFAGPGRGEGHGRPHAERSQQRHIDGDRIRSDRGYARPGRHAQHGMPYWAQGHRHRQGWSRHRPHRNYAWRAAPRGRYHGHPPYRSTARHYPEHGPSSSVRIILHGHF